MSLDLDGDAVGVWQDAFFNANEDSAEWKIFQEHLGSFDGQRLDQLAWANLFQFADPNRCRVVIDGAMDVVLGAVKTLRQEHYDADPD